MTLFSRYGGNGAFLLFAFLSLAGAILTAVFVANPQKKKEPGHLGNISSPRPDPVFQNRSIRVILAAVLLYGSGYGIFVTLIPGFLIRAKGMDQAGIGLFFTLFYIALSFSQLVAGPISDHRGKRSVMLAGLAPAALALAMFWALPNAWSLLLLFIVGAGLGVFSISSMARLNESVPESLKGTVSGAFFFSWASGYCIGPMALGQVGRIFGYPAAFMTLAGLMGLAFLAVLFFVSSNSRRSRVEVMEMTYPPRRKRGNGSV
jgi:MFS family permease